MNKIEKIELSSVYLKKNDDIGVVYCNFSEDLIFSVGYEKIKDDDVNISD